jgi:hypothetical protein
MPPHHHLHGGEKNKKSTGEKKRKEHLNRPGREGCRTSLLDDPRRCTCRKREGGAVTVTSRYTESRRLNANKRQLQQGEGEEEEEEEEEEDRPETRVEGFRFRAEG